MNFFKKYGRIVLCNLFLIFCVSIAQSQQSLFQMFSVKVNPRGTYLRTDRDDITRIYNNQGRVTRTFRPLGASSFSLSSRSIMPGDFLQLMSKGEFVFVRNDNSSISRGMLGVFVDSDRSFLNPGEDSDENIGTISLPSFNSGRSTDIPQDFYIPYNSDQCVTVQVPENASRILFSANDAFFSDNHDPDGDFKADIYINKLDVGVAYANPMQSIFAPQLNASQGYYEWPYDLVAKKAAFVQAGFDKLSSNIDSSMTFNPVLKIDDQVYTDTKCIINKIESSCSFRASDFGDEEQIYRVFVIPELTSGRHKVEVTLYPEIPSVFSSCFEDSEMHFKSFEVLVHDIQAPRIAIAKTQCMEDADKPDASKTCSLNNADYNKFTNSRRNLEINLFSAMFPVPDKEQIFFKLTHTSLFDRINDFFNAISKHLNTQTNDEDSLSRSIRLALNINGLNLRRILSRVDYIVAIATPIFFTDVLGHTDAVGLYYDDETSKVSKVGLVRSDQLNTGTMLHELGHVLGQGKDFYDGSASKCTKHDLKIAMNDREELLCKDLKPFEGYNSLAKEYVYEENSIMGAALIDEENQVRDLWIDRDTYITAFNTLKNPALDPELTIVSGIYAGGRLFNGRVNNYGAGLLELLSTQGDLRVMLKDAQNNILSEARASSTGQVEILRAGGGESMDLSVVPVMVVLPYQARASQAVIMKMEANGSETMIFSKTLRPETSARNTLLSSHNLFSTEKPLPKLQKPPGVNLLEKSAVNGTSITFSKFIYNPAIRIEFNYSACKSKPDAGDGLSLVFGKNPEDYSVSLPRGNQGVLFNGEGFSLHLDIKAGRLVLKDGNGKVLKRVTHQVATGCSEFQKLKIRINEDGTFHLLQGKDILLTYQLTSEQRVAIESQAIGWSAHSSNNGQYRVKGIKIDSIPFPRDEE